MSDNRPIGYREDSKWIYRASGYGGCLRKVVAAATGYEEHRNQYQEDIMSTAAKEGNLHEPAVIAELVEQGWKIADASQDEINLKVMPGVFIRGHIDGIGTPPRARKERLIEVKTMSKSRFQEWTRFKDARAALLSGKFDAYAWQISAYMLFTGLECKYVVKNRDSGKIHISDLKTPIYSMQQVKRRMREIHKWVLRDDLPACDGDSTAKFFCPFPSLHDDIFGEEMDDDYQPVENVTDVVLGGLAEEHARLSAVVSRGNAAYEERKEIITKMRGMMFGGEPAEDESSREVIVGGYKVVDSPRAKKKAIDYEKLADIVEERWGIVDGAQVLQELIEEAMVVPGKYRVMKVTEVK